MTRVWLEFTDADSMGRAAASHVGRIARHVLERAPLFRLALSGGTSPLGMFRHLTASAIFPPRLWERTHVFFTDERLTPLDHADSNFGAVTRHLLGRVPIPPTNIHRMPGELPPEEAVRAYATDLAQSFATDDVPVFDLVILGMGADGHTASLFPGVQHHAPLHPLVTSTPAPDLHPRIARLTLTQSVLNAAAQILFLILGAGKHPALRAIRAGTTDLPAALVDARRQSWYTCPPLPPHGPNAHPD